MGSACSGEGANDNLEELGGNSGDVEAEGEGPDSGSIRSYSRTVVFLDTSRDPTMFVPWDFENRTEGDSIRRVLRGWLGRGGQLKQFVNEEWVTPPTRSPWRILPRGAARMVVGFNDVLRELYYREGIRDLSIQPGVVMAEWSGRRGDTYRLHAATARLSGTEYRGIVVDAIAPRVAGAEPPSEWCLLIGNGSIYLLIAGVGDRESHRAWALDGSEEDFWPSVSVTWGETLGFERARRVVPVVWRFQSGDGRLVGEVESLRSHLQTLDGEGLILPVLGVYEVAGHVSVGETELPVKGFLRHFQR